MDIPAFEIAEAADEIERLLADVNRWRALADRMHDELVKNWCWHCGHEKTRNIYVFDVLEDYRQSVIDSGVFNEVTDGL